MAISNIETGEIIGCRENSPTWFHEQGHLAFNKDARTQIRAYYFEFYHRLGLVFVIFYLWSLNQYVLLFASIFVLMYWIYYAYEEAWCWIYSLRHKKEWK